ncbi:MAG: flagellar biosynthesis anti-sigma factor FlgM [Lachnospiraceae bacterium]|nr:flagellar biosynthesis anti-sigma factor FlgM [Lachnospiraceae bacterium]
MRIDAYNAVNAVYNSTKPVKKVNSEKKASKDDTLEISQFGKELHVAKKAISETEDIRIDKVEAIKKQMQEGTYYVSDEALAEKILDNFVRGI